MKTKNKICGICGKETVMWKARTRDHPAMCKDCHQKQHKHQNAIIASMEIRQEVKRIKASNPRPTLDISELKPKEDKSVPELLKLAEIVFNRFIRKRDTLSDGTFKCISCNVYFSAKEMDAGHFKSKKYSAIRFNELNVHGQCFTCNRMKDGNEKQYRINLIERIGLPLVEYTEWASNQPCKWTKQELLEIISKYK